MSTLKEKAAAYCREKNCNCAESTLLGAGDHYGLGLCEKDACLMGAFGGGLASGLTCGALCGTAAALGRLLLHGPAHLEPQFRPLVAEYVAAFRQTMGGTQCAELRDRYFDPEEGCVRAIEKASELLESFVASRGLAG